MLGALFLRLDELSHFQFTPRAVAPELGVTVKQPKNVAALALEEKTPLGIAGGDVLAPHEILDSKAIEQAQNRPRGQRAVVGKSSDEMDALILFHGYRDSDDGVSKWCITTTIHNWPWQHVMMWRCRSATCG